MLAAVNDVNVALFEAYGRTALITGDDPATTFRRQPALWARNGAVRDAAA